MIPSAVNVGLTKDLEKQLVGPRRLQFSKRVQFRKRVRLVPFKTKYGNHISEYI